MSSSPSHMVTSSPSLPSASQPQGLPSRSRPDDGKKDGRSSEEDYEILSSIDIPDPTRMRMPMAVPNGETRPVSSSSSTSDVASLRNEVVDLLAQTRKMSMEQQQQQQLKGRKTSFDESAAAINRMALPLPPSSEARFLVYGQANGKPNAELTTRYAHGLGYRVGHDRFVREADVARQSPAAVRTNQKNTSTKQGGLFGALFGKKQKSSKAEHVEKQTNTAASSEMGNAEHILTAPPPLPLDPRSRDAARSPMPTAVLPARSPLDEKYEVRSKQQVQALYRHQGYAGPTSRNAGVEAAHQGQQDPSTSARVSSPHYGALTQSRPLQREPKPIEEVELAEKYSQLAQSNKPATDAERTLQPCTLSPAGLTSHLRKRSMSTPSHIYIPPPDTYAGVQLTPQQHTTAGHPAAAKVVKDKSGTLPRSAAPVLSRIQAGHPYPHLQQGSHERMKSQSPAQYLHVPASRHQERVHPTGSPSEMDGSCPLDDPTSPMSSTPYPDTVSRRARSNSDASVLDPFYTPSVTPTTPAFVGPDGTVESHETRQHTTRAEKRQAPDAQGCDTPKYNQVRRQDIGPPPQSPLPPVPVDTESSLQRNIGDDSQGKRSTTATGTIHTFPAGQDISASPVSVTSPASSTSSLSATRAQSPAQVMAHRVIEQARARKHTASSEHDNMMAPVLVDSSRHSPNVGAKGQGLVEGPTFSASVSKSSLTSTSNDSSVSRSNTQSSVTTSDQPSGSTSTCYTFAETEDEDDDLVTLENHHPPTLRGMPALAKDSLPLPSGRLRVKEYRGGMKHDSLIDMYER